MPREENSSQFEGTCDLLGEDGVEDLPLLNLFLTPHVLSMCGCLFEKKKGLKSEQGIKSGPVPCRGRLTKAFTMQESWRRGSSQENVGHNWWGWLQALASAVSHRPAETGIGPLQVQKKIRWQCKRKQPSQSNRKHSRPTSLTTLSKCTHIPRQWRPNTPILPLLPRGKPLRMTNMAMIPAPRKQRRPMSPSVRGATTRRVPGRMVMAMALLA